ncbi:MAG: CHAD domain-containing protein [Thermoplasmatota archaeon]
MSTVRRYPAPLVKRAFRGAVVDLAHERRRLASDPGGAAALLAYRKAARRVLAVAGAAEAWLKPTTFADLMGRVACLSSGLGRCRDADVVKQRIALLCRGRPPPLQMQLRDVARHVEVPDRGRRVKARLGAYKPRRLAAALDGLSGAPLDALALALERTRLRAARGARAAATTRELHALRLDLKLVRYALEALEGVASPVALEAHEAADRLGLVADAERLRRAAAAAKPPARRVLEASADRQEHRGRTTFLAAWGHEWPHLHQALLR